MEFTWIEHRRIRRAICTALNEETDNWGGPAAADVDAFCKNAEMPGDAGTAIYARTDAVRLWWFYSSHDEPDAGRRASLWQEITRRLSKLGFTLAADPGDWGGTDMLLDFQFNTVKPNLTKEGSD